ncbi:MAG: YkgJ family cysteine cluster protein [Desulfatirhabdiaceae bacterium]
MTIQPISIHSPDGFDLLKRQKQLCQKMDHAYDMAAAHYGFVCTGCDDNCCRTRFYHHTLVEYSYLYFGMQQMEPGQQADIRDRAAEYVRIEDHRELSDATEKPWCPLNDQGRCQLYAYRPMICRLHGLPHELNTPGKGRKTGPGCNAFFDRCGHQSDYPLDRTPLYHELADIERSARQLIRYPDKIRMTIARMICHFPKEKFDES